jgi:hypothetical protein
VGSDVRRRGRNLIEQYQRLLTLAKLENELARQGDLEGLERLDAERRGIVADLPATPPAAAKPLLIDMAQLQADTTAVLTQAQAQIAAELGDTARREDTARGYGRLATPARGTFTAAA